MTTETSPQLTPTEPSQGLEDGNKPSDLPSPPAKREVRTYTVGTPVNAQHAPQCPEPAHIASETADSHQCHEHCRQSTLLTVTEVPSKSTLRTTSQSFASSGLSVNEIQTPQHVLDSMIQQPLGVYSMHAEHPASVWSGDSHDSSQDEKQVVRYSLQKTESHATKIANKDDLQALTDSHPLPKITDNQRWANARYLWFTLYRRLMILVLLANIIAIATLAGLSRNKTTPFGYHEAAIGCGANLLLGVLMRQEHVINMLFHLACALPHWVPLQIRRQAAKLSYNNGGIHAGCGNSALMWYIAYTVLLVRQFRGTQSQTRAIAATAAFELVLFITIIGMAHPSIRRKYHDYWELSHRYCGYTAIGLIWAQTIILTIAASEQTHISAGLTLVGNPVFWFLIIITLCLIYPWLWLRRVPIEAHQLSTHATELRFHNRRVGTCVGTRLSHSPLVENHGFATIAHGPDTHEKSYSVLVSNAGDFTKKLILDPPSHIWMRGAPTTGVMRVASMFSPIVVVATGSGIGPCLSFLNRHREHRMRVIWSARFPEETYQRGVLENVLRADREALIIDTKKTGHPDLPALAWALCQEIGAEAVVIISNPKVTRDVVYEMEARRVPAFGAIFDS